MRFLGLSEAQQEGLRIPDVYYSPAYGASAEVIDRGEWECAVGDDGVFFPYIKRWVGETSNYDLVTPYGYGGVASAPTAQRLREFRAEFRAVSRDRGLVAEFLRCHPFDADPGVIEALGVDEARWHTTYAVRRHADVSDYWSRAEGRHRTAVRKAEKSGVEVRTAEPSQVLDASGAFRSLYASTMERVESSARLRVGDDYFAPLLGGLGGSLTLLEAWVAGEPCAASLFMRWGDRVHYHLSGSTREGMRLGASNAIIDRAVRTLVPDGGRLHLGGGLGGDDGLARFKASMATETLTMALCRTVVDPERYESLVAEAGVTGETDYFPAYRAGART